MPKSKTHKGLAKRVKVTKRGEIKRGKAGGRHLMAGKSGKRARQLRLSTLVAPSDKRKIKTALGR